MNALQLQPGQFQRFQPVAERLQRLLAAEEFEDSEPDWGLKIGLGRMP